MTGTPAITRCPHNREPLLSYVPWPTYSDGVPQEGIAELAFSKTWSNRIEPSFTLIWFCRRRKWSSRCCSFSLSFRYRSAFGMSVQRFYEVRYRFSVSDLLAVKQFATEACQRIVRSASMADIKRCAKRGSASAARGTRCGTRSSSRAVRTVPAARTSTPRRSLAARPTAARHSRSGCTPSRDPPRGRPHP